MDRKPKIATVGLVATTLVCSFFVYVSYQYYRRQTVAADLTARVTKVLDPLFESSIFIEGLTRHLARQTREGRLTPENDLVAVKEEIKRAELLLKQIEQEYREIERQARANNVANHVSLRHVLFLGRNACKKHSEAVAHLKTLVEIAEKQKARSNQPGRQGEKASLPEENRWKEFSDLAARLKKATTSLIESRTAFRDIARALGKMHLGEGELPSEDFLARAKEGIKTAEPLLEQIEQEYKEIERQARTSNVPYQDALRNAILLGREACKKHSESVSYLKTLVEIAETQKARSNQAGPRHKKRRSA